MMADSRVASCEPADIHDDELLQFAPIVRDSVLLITGGANGIGKETVLEFARNGAKIIIGDRDFLACQPVIEECKRLGSDAIAVKCDVTNWEDQVKLFTLGAERYGKIDYVIPSAGVSEVGKFNQIGPEDDLPEKPVLTTVDINLIGALYTVRLAQHYLFKNTTSKHKALVLMGSMAGNNGLSNAELYSTTKHALQGLCRSLQPVFSANGVRLAIVCPWFVDTQILPTNARILLAGIPKARLDRVMGATVLAATDQTPGTSGATYAIPDGNLVYRIPPHELSHGVYKLLSDRSDAILAARRRTTHIAAICKDLASITHWPVLLMLPLAILYWFFADQ